MQETDDLEKAIAEMEEILRDKKRIHKIIIEELEQVSKNSASPAKHF